jgi:alcohol dehydrogenase (cytochrome c)
MPRILIDEQVAPDPKAVSWINPKIVKGKVYKVVTGIPGKTGIVYTLDRRTGQFLWARPTVMQNVVQSIDGATGKVTNNPATLFDKVGDTRFVCPSSTGGANYQAPAYSPLTKTMYFPEQNLCETVTATEPNWPTPTYSVNSKIALSPDANGKLGVITAVNAVTGKTAWKFSTRAGMQSILATGGGLLFAGGAAGRFRALDQSTGKVLWEMNLGSAVTGYPITFMAGGHQYVAVSTGFWLGDSFTPELIHGTQGTLFVFALPDAGIGQAGPPRAPVNPGSAPMPLDPGGPAPAPLAPTGDGKAVYEKSCAACHGGELQGGGEAPPLKGAAFLANWKGKSAALYSFIHQSMPPGAGGSLSDTDYRAVTAYILQANGVENGAAGGG